MKKGFFILLAIVVIALVAWLLLRKGGCGDVNGSESEGEDVFSYNSVIVEKSDSSKFITFSVAVDVPTHGPKELTDVIMRNIAIHMGTDSTDTVKVSLEEIAEKFILESAEDMAQFSEGSDNSIPVSYSFEGKIKVQENTEKYITYFYDTYMYTGGAHGMPQRGYFTIDKSDNRVLKLNDVFVEGKENELKGLIRKGLEEQYYKEKHEWDGVFTLDLPVQEPGITADGVVICYGAYETDCYAAGTPFCVIPFKDADDMLSERVRNLIK